jgi:hypothetical protein
MQTTQTLQQFQVSKPIARLLKAARMAKAENPCRWPLHQTFYKDRNAISSDGRQLVVIENVYHLARNSENDFEIEEGYYGNNGLEFFLARPVDDTPVQFIQYPSVLPAVNKEGDGYEGYTSIGKVVGAKSLFTLIGDAKIGIDWYMYKTTLDALFATYGDWQVWTKDAESPILLTGEISGKTVKALFMPYNRE